MTITVEVDATGEIDIDLSDEDIKDVINIFDGNFDEWAKCNYSHHIEWSNMDIDIDRISYDKNEAEVILDKAKDMLCLKDDFNFDKQIAVKTLLKQNEVFNKPIDIATLKVDIEQIALAFEYVDFNNPKTSLNYVYLDGTDIVATDTRQLICINNHKYEISNVFFPIYFILPMLDGAKCYICSDKTLYLEYKNSWYSGLDMNKTWNLNEKYIDYNRILSGIDNIKEPTLEFKKFSSNSITRQVDDDVAGKLIEISVNDMELYINEKYYNNLIGIHEHLHSCYFSKENAIFFCGKNVRIGVMPITL